MRRVPRFYADEPNIHIDTDALGVWASVDGDLPSGESGGAGQARLVMRQRANLRLLLNANLWPQMVVSQMDGGKGATLAVVNAVTAGEEGASGVSSATDARAPPVNEVVAQRAPTPYAVRFKSSQTLAEFVRTVESYKILKPVRLTLLDGKHGWHIYNTFIANLIIAMHIPVSS